ncbi:MAG: hypothetical protein GEU99_19500 [Luteitalea sp.]|nr:hypothetical protein [Luteitalea sp.]
MAAARRTSADRRQPGSSRNGSVRYLVSSEAPPQTAEPSRTAAGRIFATRARPPAAAAPKTDPKAGRTENLFHLSRVRPEEMSRGRGPLPGDLCERGSRLPFPMLYSPLMLDEVTQAVLSREQVARYLRGGEGLSPVEARERIYAYLDELRTTQRYHIYRALKHPLYPILRKLTRIGEGMEHVERTVAAGRAVYVSNHRSHLDYLIGPLILEDYAVRPPIIAAGINVFGGAFGLIQRHVTGAIPIRRNSRDPAYLATLKVYVAEMLDQHDLLFYPEGGRSYTGDLKSFKTGLFNATLLAQDLAHTHIVPCALTYDLVLEDRTLARQGVKRRQRPFTREIAEMVGSAVGYETRVFVTFGPPIPLATYRPDSRRDVLQLAHLTRERVGRLYKVLPTALVATAMGPSIAEADLTGRVADLIATLAARGANLDITDPTMATERGVGLLALRGVIVRDGKRLRVRERAVLRYYARALDHLLTQT